MTEARERPGGGESGDIDRLAALLCRAPTAAERAAWAKMSPAQKEKASDRLDLLRRWTGDRGDLTAASAAETIGVKAKRFYEIVSAWKQAEEGICDARDEAANALAALGSFAIGSEKVRKSRFDPDAINALQSLVADVARRTRGASIEVTRRALQEAAVSRLRASGIAGASEKMPSKMIVRRIIERELDRSAEAEAVGHAIRMDHSAISLAGEDGRLHVAYFVLERAAHLVLGFSLGSLEDVVGGYAAAAADAAGRLKDAPRLEWARMTSRIDMVRGFAGPEAERFLTRATTSGGVPDVAITAAGEHGRYLRQILGDRLGTVYFRSARTTTRAAKSDLAGGRYAPADAWSRIDAELTQHNCRSEKCRAGSGAPPENLVVALSALAASQG